VIPARDSAAQIFRFTDSISLYAASIFFDIASSLVSISFWELSSYSVTDVATSLKSSETFFALDLIALNAF
jgi:hypothetical protein